MKTKSLLTSLRACPTHETFVSRELFLECWNELTREDVTPFNKPTLPVMAALVLHDDRFEALLNEAEQEQLRSIVQLALDRYAEQTQPPNKLGRLLSGLTKGES